MKNNCCEAITDRAVTLHFEWQTTPETFRKDDTETTTFIDLHLYSVLLLLYTCNK